MRRKMNHGEGICLPSRSGKLLTLYQGAVDRVQALQVRLGEMEKELETVKRERDAAKSDLDNSAPCFACIHFKRNGGECGGGMACWEEMHRCIISNEEYTGVSFFWRGVCPENTEVQK